VNILRPKTFDDFVGNENNKECLRMQLEAAKMKNESLKHTIFQGSSGCGKTSISELIASTLGGTFHNLNGASLTKKRHIFELACKIKEKDVVFIDEIHRLDIALEEMCYPIMEDFVLTLPKSVSFGGTERLPFSQIKIPKFTLIGATTDIGLLSEPFLSRFQNHYYLEQYTTEELAQIIAANAIKLELDITTEAIIEIAKRSRKVPRVANARLSWIHDYALSNKIKRISHQDAITALDLRQIDSLGLEQNDRKYLAALSISKPMGINSIVAMSRLTPNTIINYIEPYLISINRIEITPKGRLKIPSPEEMKHIKNTAHKIEDMLEEDDLL
jgi:Holliday junction DNA helicase RuvB